MDRQRSRYISRYELKYVVGIEQIGALREVVGARLDPDPLFPGGRQLVWSLYYDTPGLRCYWEKIDGESFRRKLRIRHYGDPYHADDDTEVWAEIKQRHVRTTSKRRLQLPYRAARELCAGHVPDGLSARDQEIAEDMASMVARRSLLPAMMVGYVREAYEGRGLDDGLRITFDIRLRGRDRDLHFGGDVTGDRNILDPTVFVLEIKVDDRVPRWVTGMCAELNLLSRPISKYCRAIESVGCAPRSLLHSVESSVREASE